MRTCACTPPASRSRISTPCAPRWVIERINLYGNSYGTRVAQHYARRYPQATRTLILDGVVNPETVLGPAIAIDAERALERILARCTADASCAKAFADPFADYHALRERLARKPEPATVADAKTGRPIHFDFTHRHLSAVLRLASYNDDQAALLPLSLHLAMHEDNFMPLANQFRVFARSLERRLRLRHAQQRGLQRGHAADRRREARPARRSMPRTWAPRRCSSSSRPAAIGPRAWSTRTCTRRSRAAAAVLLLSGADDPVTPPEYATIAQRAFADSKHVIIAGHGHGQLGVPCVDRVMANFIDAGSAKDLDVSCTQKVPPMPFFTTLAGPAP